MHHHFKDITSRIAEPPKWWDEHGVPRFCDFAPTEVADIYANEAALVLITCQNCGHEFEVAISLSDMDKIEAMGRYEAKGLDTLRAAEKAWELSLARMIKEKTIHYGDPPNTGCCAAGPTMNSEPRRVLQYWERGRTDAKGKMNFDWERDPSLELNIEPD